MKMFLTECLEFVGTTVQEFEGEKRYISTGALDKDHVNEADVELVTYENRPSRANLQAVAGDILFAKMANTEKTFMVDSISAEDIYSTGFCAVRANDKKILRKCLFYFLSSSLFLEQKDKNSSGATQKAITNSGLAQITITLPSLEEQQKFVGQMDLLNDAITARTRQLAMLDDLVKSRFVEMFGTIDDNRFGYKECSLQDVCEPIKDGTHQTPEYTDDTAEGYKFLSSKDVTSGTIDWTHLKYIPEYLHRELYARIAPRKGDILLAKNGTTGVAAIVDRDEVFDIYVSLALIRPLSVDTTYLWAAINSTETKRQFDRSLKGIGVPNLHLGEIKKVRILHPPKDKQNRFAAFVAEVDKSKLAVKQSLEKLETLKKSLMQQYFG